MSSQFVIFCLYIVISGCLVPVEAQSVVNDDKLSKGSARIIINENTISINPDPIMVGKEFTVRYFRKLWMNGCFRMSKVKTSIIKNRITHSYASKSTRTSRSICTQGISSDGFVDTLSFKEPGYYDGLVKRNDEIVLEYRLEIFDYNTSSSRKTSLVDQVNVIGAPSEYEKNIVILKAIKWDDSRSRSAVNWMYRSRDPRSFDVLENALAFATESFKKRPRFHPNYEKKSGALFSDYLIDVRPYIAFTIGKFGDFRAVSALIDYLHDENYLLRKAVVNSLGNFNTKRSIEALKSVESDKSEQVRTSAIKALKNLGVGNVD